VTAAEIEKTVAAFEASLKKQAKPERAEFEKKYLKSNLRFLGANVPATRNECVRFFRANKSIDKRSLDLLCDVLWQTDCHELRSVAIGLMERFRDKLGPKDLPRLRRMIIESAGWAHVDTIAVHLVGSIYERNSAIEKTLRKWSTHTDFWVRRASILALLNEARHGNEKAFELFSELASTMIGENDFFIRKAIGWILREVSKKQPNWSFEFLKQHAAQASGLTFREGSKYLPENQRRLLERCANSKSKRATLGRPSLS
jgi:3-methyladenine DNA glycosylase AlkD